MFKLIRIHYIIVPHAGLYSLSCELTNFLFYTYKTFCFTPTKHLRFTKELILEDGKEMKAAYGEFLEALVEEFDFIEVHFWEIDCPKIRGGFKGARAGAPAPTSYFFKKKI